MIVALIFYELWHNLSILVMAAILGCKRGFPRVDFG